MRLHFRHFFYILRDRLPSRRGARYPRPSAAHWGAKRTLPVAGSVCNAQPRSLFTTDAPDKLIPVIIHGRSLIHQSTTRHPTVNCTNAYFTLTGQYFHVVDGTVRTLLLFSADSLSLNHDLAVGDFMLILPCFSLSREIPSVSWINLPFNFSFYLVRAQFFSGWWRGFLRGRHLQWRVG